MLAGQWKTATVLNGQTLSAEVDLAGEFTHVLVIIPTITSSTVAVSVAEKSGGTFGTYHRLNVTATGSFAYATTAGLGGITVLFEIGAGQFVKVVCGSAQGADRVFNIRGVNLL